MARYVAILAYDGSAYHGYQRQAEGIPTIQSVVEETIGGVTGQNVSVIGAGRTDTGVHAVGQVIAFDVEWSHPDYTLLLAVNSHLPDDIALQRIWQQEGFHPRFDAHSRQYRYTVAEVPARNPLWNPQAWQIFRQKLDLDAMQLASQQLIGEHDFGTFGQPPEGSTHTIREVFRSDWDVLPQDHGKLYIYRISATAFLYHMVRRIVGTLMQVGLGRMTLDEFMAIFHSCDTHQAKILAPPQGLVLEAVQYPQDLRATQIATETSETPSDRPLEEER